MRAVGDCQRETGLDDLNNQALASREPDPLDEFRVSGFNPVIAGSYWNVRYKVFSLNGLPLAISKLTWGNEIQPAHWLPCQVTRLTNPPHLNANRYHAPATLPATSRLGVASAQAWPAYG